MEKVNANKTTQSHWDYDFIIIGSGFGGSVSALRLSEKGYRVLVLETGKRFATQDFAKTNWNIFKYLWAPLIRCFGILRMTLVSDVLILSGAGVGGGSLGYANTLLEPKDNFFKDPSWSHLGDWKTQLAVHFATAKKMLGVAPLPGLTPSDELIKELASSMCREHTFKMQDVGVFFGTPGVEVSDPYFSGMGPSRTGCTGCGGCMVGCRVGAKNTLDKNYLYLAEKNGVEIMAEREVTSVSPLVLLNSKSEPETGYKIRSVSSTRFLLKNRREFYTRQVIVAAGVLGTLRLLAACRDKGQLSKISPMLGKRVRTNSEALTGIISKDSKADYSKGVAITSSFFPDDQTHIEPVRYPAGSDLMSLLSTALVSGKGQRQRIGKWLLGIVFHPWRTLQTLWPVGWAKRTIIFLVMQTLDNSIEIFRTRKWWWPFGMVLSSRQEGTREKIPVQIPIAQVATRLGAHKIGGIAANTINEVLLNVGTTAHILGGAVMGKSPEEGVINEKNEVFGYPGMYIIDGSMIPANLGVNPSLTITAMAEHAMSHIPPAFADQLISPSPTK